MTIAEGVQTTIDWKFYTSGTISETTEDQAPGASGAYRMRRIASSLTLARDAVRSQEIRTSRQVAHTRLSQRRVTGNIEGELSPGTWFSWFEAVHRDTRAAGLTKTQTELTSVAASASGSTITFGGGDPVSEGLRVGDIVQFSGMTRKRTIFPCYGMQWGSSLYLYPIEECLVEEYHAPPTPAQMPQQAPITPAPGVTAFLEKA